MLLYCPRCDRKITPDHKCLSRRFFLGLLGGATAATMFPPSDGLTINLIKRGLPIPDGEGTVIGLGGDSWTCAIKYDQRTGRIIDIVSLVSKNMAHQIRNSDSSNLSRRTIW